MTLTKAEIRRARKLGKKEELKEKDIAKKTYKEYFPKTIKAYKKKNSITDNMAGMECVVQKILLHNELRNPIFGTTEQEFGETAQSSKAGSVLGAKTESTQEDHLSSGSRKILGRPSEKAVKKVKAVEVSKLQNADAKERRTKWDARKKAAEKPRQCLELCVGGHGDQEWCLTSYETAIRG